MVTAGSTRTRSPLAVVSMVILVTTCCSASRGEMFDLKRPVPTPKMMRPTEKTPMEVFGLAMTLGAADAVRTMCPIIATKMAIWMVL